METITDEKQFLLNRAKEHLDGSQNWIVMMFSFDEDNYCLGMVFSFEKDAESNKRQRKGQQTSQLDQIIINCVTDVTFVIIFLIGISCNIE